MRALKGLITRHIRLPNLLLSRRDGTMQQRDLPALVVMRMITSFPSSANWTACIWTIGSHLLTTQRNKRTNQVGNDSQRRGHGETWLTSRGYDADQLLQSREQIPPLARLSVASCRDRKSVTSARSLAREANGPLLRGEVA